MTTAEHLYKRKDGGETYCYGELRDDSNFQITCDDENNDGAAADDDDEGNYDGGDGDEHSRESDIKDPVCDGNDCSELKLV